MNRTIVSERDVVRRNAVLGPTESGAALVPDRYFDRLLKYVPPEVISTYAALEGMISGSQGSDRDVAAWLVFAVMGLCTPLYLYRVVGVTKMLQIVISSIAFVVWAFTFPGLPFSTIGVDPVFRSVLLILFIFLIPIVVV